MKLMINTSTGFLSKENTFEGFILRILLRLKQQQTGHTFQFLTSVNNNRLSEETGAILLKPPFFVKMFESVWLRREWSTVIRKCQPDLVITINNPLPKTSIPQLLILSAGFGKIPAKPVKKGLSLGQYNRLITSSNRMRQELIRGGFPENSIDVLLPSPRPWLQPLSHEQKEDVKNTYSDGKEFFFLLAGNASVTYLINALKAFSQFKKWQQSNMRLIIEGINMENREIRQAIETYRYRKDVMLPEKELGEKEYTAIMASAQLMIHLSSTGPDTLVAMEALRCGVPFISGCDSLAGEDIGSSILYRNPAEPSAFAAEMLKLYKDEKYRKALIQQGIESVKTLSEERAMQKLWENIQLIAAR
ncbi:MAG: glycosyltransferase [Chitinophagaceae bacterium]|nr:glycosyltransferase [Chitinophagaceae bacterium]